MFLGRAGFRCDLRFGLSGWLLGGFLWVRLVLYSDHQL